MISKAQISAIYFVATIQFCKKFYFISYSLEAFIHKFFGHFKVALLKDNLFRVAKNIGSHILVNLLELSNYCYIFRIQRANFKCDSGFRRERLLEDNKKRIPRHGKAC